MIVLDGGSMFVLEVSTRCVWRGCRGSHVASLFQSRQRVLSRGTGLHHSGSLRRVWWGSDPCGRLLPVVDMTPG